MGQPVFILTLIFAFIYALFICWCIYGWIRLDKKSLPDKSRKTSSFATVIIPARNEEGKILQCLSDFSVQDFSKSMFEVIVVDDNSSDQTAAQVKLFIAENPGLNCILLEQKKVDGENLFKKNAIASAVKMAKGDVVLTTDADCRRGPEWISTMVYFHEAYQAEMTCGLVAFETEKTLLEKIQSLEYLGLIGIGASSIKNNLPLLCNGANLAFSKKVFEEVGGYRSGKNYASGDDTQLMHKIARRGSKKVVCNAAREARVTTHPEHNLHSLINQRKRWASKITGQMSVFTVFIAAVAYLLHLGLLFAACSVFFGEPLYFLLLPLLMKMIPEFILLALVSSFFSKSKSLFLFLPAQVIYPFYIAVVGVTSLAGSYQWKGRQIK